MQGEGVRFCFIIVGRLQNKCTDMHPCAGHWVPRSPRAWLPAVCCAASLGPARGQPGPITQFNVRVV